MKNLLYIGLNGYAGAGKDTVAKILKVILNNFDKTINECKEIFNIFYKNPMISATYGNINNEYDSEYNKKVICIAYADQLKTICSTIFGIPLDRFYMNKSNAWICINDKFQYTEIKPEQEHIITADEYYYKYSDVQYKPYYNNEFTKYWMSLREILVYVGTYVCQQSINKSIFVNIVRNKIKEECRKNNDIEYVIVTDNRFIHELDYMKEVNAITFTIERNDVTQLSNVAEHDLDDEESYDFVIDNSGTYDELFEQVYNIIHNNVIFKNNTYNLNTRENINNYLREVDDNEYMVCMEIGLQKVLHFNENDISMLDIVGGPTICVDTEVLPDKVVESIRYDEDKQRYIISFY